MARTGGGERRGRRRRSFHRASNEYGDDRFDADNSDGNSLSSGYDDMDFQSRDRDLDDALFGFFRKQSLKTLKRNFSDYCQDVGLSPNNRDKRCRRDVVEKSTFTKYSLKYFVEIIKKLTKHQRGVIEKLGFGCLLFLDLCDIPSEFARWVANCIDPVCSQITVGSKTFDISKRTFHIILGLPFGGFDIECHSKEGAEFILGLFGLSSLPHITFFGNKLSGTDELSDQDIFVCFMTIALHCFLCPSSEEHVSGNYLAFLKHPEKAKDHDLCKLVYEHCLASVNHFILVGKLKGRRQRAPLCCNYALVVRYLDCLDFGRQNVDDSVPRIAVWRGNMIKFFSELDRKKRHQYGKRQLREDFGRGRTADVKYKTIQSPVFQSFSPGFRKNVHTSFASNLRPEIIDGIISIAENGVSNISASNKPKFQLLVTNVLDFLRRASVPPKPAPIPCAEPQGSNVLEKAKHAQITSKSLAPNTCDKPVTDVRSRLQQSAAPIKNVPDSVIPGPVTPDDCMITKVAPAFSQMTAPAVKPMIKVQKRRCKLISAAEEETFLSNGLLKSNMRAGADVVDVSPIARFTLPDTPVVQPRTDDFRIKRSNPAQGPGTKAAPILIAEASTNPKNAVMVGSNDFMRRSRELSKQADTTYNNILLSQRRGDVFAPSSDHLHNGQPVEQPLNVQVLAILKARAQHKFLNYVMKGQNPPLQHNSRFCVSDEDIINYAAIVELGHNPPHMTLMGIDYPEVHCNYKSVGSSLMPGGEVDNFILTCFCRLLFKEKHPSASGRHYFFPIIGDAILKYQDFPNDTLIRNTFEGAAKTSKGRNLGSKDNTLCFPIVDSHHWFLFAVDFDKKVFAFLDSLHDKDSNFHLRKKNLLIDNFIHLWELYVSKVHNLGEFRYMYPNVPKQQNTLDCGVFTMKCMETWKPSVDLRSLFSYQDILNIRIQIANRLYFHSHNDTDMSLVTDYFSQE